MNFLSFLRIYRSSSNSDIKKCDGTSRISGEFYKDDTKSSHRNTMIPDGADDVVIVESVSEEEVENQVVISSDISKNSTAYMSSENPLSASRLLPAKNILSPRSSILPPRPSLIEEDLEDNEQHEKSKAHHYSKLGQTFVQSSHQPGGGSILMSRRPHRQSATKIAWTDRQ